MKGIIRSFFAVYLFVISLSAGATTILSGDHDLASGNRFPFGSSLGDRYQMVYDSGLFSGPVNIDSFSFFVSNTGTTATANLNIYMSHTNKEVDALDMLMDNNLGGDNTLVWTGMIGDTLAVGERLTFLTDWAYDPSQGNLLIDFMFFDQFSSFIGFEDMSNTIWTHTHSRMHNFGGGFEGFGLVTEFNVSDVPEPGTLALIGLGLAGFGCRRRKAA